MNLLYVRIIYKSCVWGLLYQKDGSPKPSCCLLHAVAIFPNKFEFISISWSCRELVGDKQCDHCGRYLSVPNETRYAKLIPYLGSCPTGIRGKVKLAILTQKRGKNSGGHCWLRPGEHFQKPPIHHSALCRKRVKNRHSEVQPLLWMVLPDIGTDQIKTIHS